MSRRRRTTAKGSKKTYPTTPPTKDNGDPTYEGAEARPEDSVAEPVQLDASDSTVDAINRIPPEILMIIFEDSLERRCRYEYAEDKYSHFYYNQYYYHHGYVMENDGGTVIPWMYPVTDPFHFMTISAVCRYWRMVALDTPVLWNNVSPANVAPDGPRTYSDLKKAASAAVTYLRSASQHPDPPVVKQRTRAARKKFASAALAYLKRAGQHPVNLVVDQPGQAIDVKELLSFLDPDILPRLREIHCHYLPPCSLDSIFKFPAPILESLHLGPVTHTGVFYIPRGEIYAQRKPLFDGVTPRLRYLSLAYMEDAVPKLHAPSLTHLHLHHCSLAFRLSSLANDLASDLLKDFPELTDLSLSNVRFSRGHPTRPEVHFGKLRRFTLHGMHGSDDIRSIMNYLSIPSNASVLLRDCTPLTPELVQGSEGLKDYFARQSWTRISVCKYPQRLTLERPTPYISVIGTDDHVGVAFDWSRGPIDNRYSLRTPIPLQGVHECWIMEIAGTSVALCVPELRGMLKDMAGLRTLVVCPWNARTVLASLKAPSNETGSDTNTPRICPILTEVRVIARKPHHVSANTLRALHALRRSRALERVVVCYLHPGAEAQDPGRGSTLQTGGVEYVHLKELAEMELPPVCKTEEHAFWPKWRSHADTVFGG
ncbi:hypothetical protein FOMPIDRAFT_112948 [Fomitopsis schrenkii]|uniref:Uncharacterized protein n=1 Tax=Fomitopsis schrenkii TaxID=2126942 RepID=S8DRK0_FOMSC|nr:hypothetical protein FOMPIDRAFT_112948 [Fomitopsis schrenkii]